MGVCATVRIVNVVTGLGNSLVKETTHQRAGKELVFSTDTLDERMLSEEGMCYGEESYSEWEMKLPLYPFFRFLLRQYNLAPTQLVPNA